MPCAVALVRLLADPACGKALPPRQRLTRGKANLKEVPSDKIAGPATSVLRSGSEQDQLTRHEGSDRRLPAPIAPGGFW